jgi:tetratricopeptide (TPR) repeat protein
MGALSAAGDCRFYSVFSGVAAERADAKLYLQLGNLQRAAGRVPEALISYQRSFSLDPNLAEARVALEELDASQ